MAEVMDAGKPVVMFPNLQSELLSYGILLLDDKMEEGRFSPAGNLSPIGLLQG
ncbi:hypothetical protein [Prevotella dentasini]|uniref:hypothetical protein n=1 Tax=Prevotella dentasini TaxID=589537 RepID=UPI00131F4238|nr:hypothetical protein [Prevotella dentasini]